MSPPASCQQQQQPTIEPEPECEQHEDCEQLRQLQLDADTADRLQLRTEDQFCCYDLSDLERASRAVAAKRCCAEMEAVIMPPNRNNLTQVEMKQVSVYSRDIMLIWQKLEFIYCHKNLGLNDQDRKIYGTIFICCHIGNFPP